MRVMGLCVLLIFAVPEAFSQLHEGPDHEPSMQINFAWAIPQGELNDALARDPVGLSLTFGGEVPGVPLQLLTELTGLTYGHDQQLQLFDLEDVPVEVVSIANSYNVGMGHLVARLQPQTGAIRPYVDAMAGMKMFVTHTKVDSDVIVFHRGLHAKSSSKDWAISYGGGAGLEIHVFSGKVSRYARPATFSLNLGVRYLFGEPATFAQADSFREVDGLIEFDRVRSRTDMLMPHFGISASL